MPPGLDRAETDLPVRLDHDRRAPVAGAPQVGDHDPARAEGPVQGAVGVVAHQTKVGGRVDESPGHEDVAAVGHEIVGVVAAGPDRRDDHAGAYEYRSGWNDREEIVVPAPSRGATLMFEDFTAMLGDPGWREASIRISERTQEWLDAVWTSALANEES